MEALDVQQQLGFIGDPSGVGNRPVGGISVAGTEITVSTTPYELISTPSQLRLALPVLEAAPSLALDMEMENHCHLYGLYIALIQLSTPDNRHYIIDPLADIDLQPLGKIFSDPARQTILHDADFDRRAAAQVYGWKLHGIFDTKIAAQLCGHRKFGLGNLLAEYFNVTANKRFQTMNWMKRPIPEEALSYAVGDTAYLHALRDRLSARLSELGRTAWAEEEFDCAERREMRAPESPLHHRIKRSSLLTPRQLAVLGALSDFRDQQARRINRPLHFIMRNEIMLDLAKRSSLTLKDLRELRGVHPVLRQPRNLDRLLAAWHAGRQAPEEQHMARVRRPRSAPNYKLRLKAMQQWRAELALEFDLEPYLLLDNDVLTWCANHPGQAPGLEVAGLVRRWQRQVVWPRFVEKFEITTPLPD